MNAKELRIGNTVIRKPRYSNEKDQIVIVEDIRDDGINSRSEYHTGILFKDINAIPLTEEWLLKFGFEKGGTISNNVCLPNGGTEFPHGATEFTIKKNYTNVLFLNGVFYYEFGMATSEIVDEYFYKEIIYVNQLQNLYFALTGEELILQK